MAFDDDDIVQFKEEQKRGNLYGACILTVKYRFMSPPNIPLVAAGQPAEVESLARSIDELMTSIAQRAGNADGNRVSVLACLHLADRLRSMERELSQLKTRVDEKSREFSLLLDSAMN